MPRWKVIDRKDFTSRGLLLMYACCALGGLGLALLCPPGGYLFYICTFFGVTHAITGLSRFCACHQFNPVLSMLAGPLVAIHKVLNGRWMDYSVLTPSLQDILKKNSATSDERKELNAKAEQRLIFDQSHRCRNLLILGGVSMIGLSFAGIIGPAITMIACALMVPPFIRQSLDFRHTHPDRSSAYQKVMCTQGEVIPTDKDLKKPSF